MQEEPLTDEIPNIPELDTSLLPIFQRYKDENASWDANFDVWSYLSLRADSDLAAAFTKLFWPDFIEVDGCVILKRRYSPEILTRWMEQYGDDRRAVETTVNHVHVKDLFLNSTKESSEQLYDFLVDALAFGWKQALQTRYPDKHFTLIIRRGYDPELTFRQVETHISESD